MCSAQIHSTVKSPALPFFFSYGLVETINYLTHLACI